MTDNIIVGIIKNTDSIQVTTFRINLSKTLKELEDANMQLEDYEWENDAMALLDGGLYNKDAEAIFARMAIHGDQFQRVVNEGKLDKVGFIMSIEYHDDHSMDFIINVRTLDIMSGLEVLVMLVENYEIPWNYKTDENNAIIIIPTVDSYSGLKDLVLEREGLTRHSRQIVH